MDNFLHRKATKTQHNRNLFASLKIFDGFMRWLDSLIHLTEEQQEDAGIYTGYSVSSD
jgi:hypothetical protein